MTVTIQKQVPVEVPVQEEKFAKQQIVEAVDEYGEERAKLMAKMAKLEPLQKKVSGLENDLRTYVDLHTPKDEEAKLEGEKYEALFGKMGNQAEITDKALVREMLGDELFFELAKISITDLRSYLNPKQLKKVLQEERKMKRRIKVEVRGQA